MASLSGFEENIRMLHVELKEEQRKAVKELLSGKDVLAVLRTGFGKSRIYQAFTTLKNMETDGQTVVFIISPLTSIMNDQLKELKTLGYAAANLSELSTVELKECEFNILLSSAEEAMTIGFQNELKHHRNLDRKKVSIIYGYRKKTDWYMLCLSSVVMYKINVYIFLETGVKDDDVMDILSGVVMANCRSSVLSVNKVNGLCALLICIYSI